MWRLKIAWYRFRWGNRFVKVVLRESLIILLGVSLGGIVVIMGIALIGAIGW